MRLNKVVILQFFIISIFLLAMATEYSFCHDIYEVDDTYLQANVIVPNDADAQEHTLHDVDDVDWVKFYALAGQSYMFLRYGSSEAKFRYIILYGPDGKTFVDYAENETLYWQCPADGEGIYYVEIFDIQEAGPGVTDYTIMVRTDLSLGLPVFLTGQIKNTCNQSVPNARIKVLGNLDTNSGMSLPDGSFVASLKFEGSYTVTVYANNHQTLVQNVHVPGNKTFLMTRNNNPPVAKNDRVNCLVKESVSGNVLNNDFDSDGDSLVAVLDSNVKHGSLVFNSTGAFTYKHNGTRTTADSFTYHVSDGCSISNTVTVNITITQTPLTFLMLLLQSNN